MHHAENHPCKCYHCSRQEDIVEESSTFSLDDFEIKASDWNDYEDGSATVTLEMSKTALKFFAQQGLLHVLADAAVGVVDNSKS